MRFSLTILNVTSTVFMIGIITYTIINYQQLSENGGWGLLSLFGLVGINLLAFLIDLILQRFIKEPFIVYIIGLIIVISLVILIMMDL